MRNLNIIIFFSTSFLSNLVSAQLTLFHGQGSSPGDECGISIIGADLNGDGINDTVVGCDTADVNGVDDGQVRIYDGRTHVLLYTLSAPSSSYSAAGFSPNGMRFGIDVERIGDFNNDGFQDLVVGAPFLSNVFLNQGALFLYSGASLNSGNLNPAAIFYGSGANSFVGLEVATLNDVSGDGINDLAAHEQFSGGTVNVVRIISTANLSVITSYTLGAGQYVTELFSVSDLNGDGAMEILIADTIAGLNSGAVSVVSGATGTVLAILNSPALGNFFGYSARELGDMTGDGYPEIAVSAFQGGLGNFIYVFSGANFTQVATVSGYIDAAPYVDLTGDGVPEVILAGSFFVGALGNRQVVDVVDGALLMGGQLSGAISRFVGPQNVSFGLTITNLGDTTFDSIPEIGIGAPASLTGPVSGAVDIVTPLITTNLPAYCSFQFGTLSVLNVPALGGNLQLSFSGQPSTAGFLFISLYPNVPLSISTCSIWQDLSVIVLPFFTDSLGSASGVLPLPSSGQYPPFQVALQVAQPNSSLISGYAVSNAVVASIF